MTSPQGSPAGWYPDTERGGTKYWDGVRWTGDERPPRRPFAAKAAHRGWGVVLVVFGGLYLISSPVNFAPATVDPDTGKLSTPGGVGGFVAAIVLSLLIMAWGVYLLRGRGASTKIVAANVKATAEYEAALGALKSEVARSQKPRAALVTAFLVLQAAAARRYGDQAAALELPKALPATGFDMSMVSSPLLGAISGVSVYKDWVIAGTRALDITSATRSQFHLDHEARTVTTSQAKGSKVVSTSVEAPRGGQLQVVGASGSDSFLVGPSQVAAARRLAEQINMRAEELKQLAASVSQNRASTEAEQIRAIANPETAKALQNLQNLLYTRVISDEEFDRMKSKLLGNTGPSDWS